MRLISPIKQEQCSRLIGLPVCTILQDGSRHFGVLSRAQNGKLYLNDDGEKAKTSAIPEKVTSAVNKKSRVNSKALISNDASAKTVNSQPFNAGFPDFGPYGLSGSFKDNSRKVVDLASISVLFPL
ncbi:MAG: hypothetical protein K0Q81_1646 [Paenibacillus sp.]|nr:hypothetical protein [Paenibacillus sp.]